MGWLVWDKGQRDFSLADGELAWTSFDKALRIFTYARASALQDGKEHPTQKALALMEWCLNLRASKSDIIFDPFLGSGTTALASERLGRRWIGIEKEPKYCAIAQKRIDAERAQGKLW
jgi:DNA modification methylase